MVSHMRTVASSRTRATSLASVVTPGSSTCRFRSQATASVKNSFSSTSLDSRSP